MKRTPVLSFLLLFVAFGLISWGRKGHQAVGYIAMSHLTPKTALVVAGLLKAETLADVSTYPDDIRADTIFNFMGPWHYIDVPPHQDFPGFSNSVLKKTDPNIYESLLHWEGQLKDTAMTPAIRIFALKWIVHQVGDMHQPLHVARTEDQGGNLVKCFFLDSATNLHKVWDVDLIEHTGKTAVELAEEWDQATPATTRQYQADSLLRWLYESNQAADRIYAALPASKRLGETYYTSNIALVKQRIDQAGIRLAGLLNLLLDPR